MKRFILLLLAITAFPFITIAQSFDKVIENYYIGAHYYKNSQYDSALFYFEKALVDLDEGTNGVLIDGANIRTHIANTYCQMSRLSKAISFGEDALIIYEQLKGSNSSEYAIGLRNQVWYFESAGQIQDAIESCRKAAEIFRSLNGINDPSYISSIEKLAYLYLKAGDVKSSKSCYKRSLVLEEQVYGRNSENYALVLNNLGFVYSREGCYDTAALYYENSKWIRKEVLGADHKKYKETQHNLVIVYDKLGNKKFDQGDEVGALNAFLNAKEIIDESCDSINYTSCVLNISRCYWVLGNFSKAIEYGMDGAVFASAFYGENSIEHARALVPLVYFFTTTGNYDLADEVGLLAQTILKDNNVEDPTLLHYLALLKQSKDEQSNSNPEVLLLSLDEYIKKNGKSGQGYSAILNNLALSYESLGDYENAIKYGKECLEVRLLQLGDGHSDYIITLFNLARMYNDAGRCEDALSLYKSCVFNEPSRAQSYFIEMTKEERYKYWLLNSSRIKDILDVYECNKDNDNLSVDIYNSLLFSKGVLLCYDKAIRDVVYKQSDTAIISHYELYNQVRSLFFLNRNNEYSEYQYKKLFDMCEKSERMIMDDIKEDLRRYMDSINVTFNDVIDALSDHSVAIEFCEGSAQNDYFAIITKKSFCRPIIVSLNNEVRWDSLLFVQQRLNNKLPINYKDVWSPIDAYIEEGDTVYFAMDGILHQINIENLADSAGKMACEKYYLQRVSSTRQICRKHSKPSYNSVALFGGLNYEMNNMEMIVQNAQYQNHAVLTSRGLNIDSTERAGWKYLLGTKEEVQSIYKICENQQVKTFLFTGNDGTEETFKSLSGQHIPIIHIATHGFFFDDEKASDKNYFQAFDWSNKHLTDNSLQRSGLILSGGQNAWLGGDIPDDIEDGILLSEEIASMDLSGTDLVVLSACETGLGDITSDGVFGLQRAFKMAGVRTLIMSLWKVDDNATSLMMQTFYEHLLSGMSKREAFNLAQAAVRAKYPEPYYWAGFVMLD